MQWKNPSWIETKRRNISSLSSELLHLSESLPAANLHLPSLLISLKICPRVQGRDFDALLSEEDTISFLRDLGYAGVINSLNDVVVDQMHQPWRTFVALINRILSGKTSALYKLRLSRTQILWGMYHQKYVDYVELLWEDFTY
ncbi:hypothetical protein Tco_0940710 [Tanacetum coccineum]|uniref:Uncharacterized protein n=1 Tax=Tanacetum coccineum TaxID=301880 RepID=A0ABQ5DNR4_9ASTR